MKKHQIIICIIGVFLVIQPVSPQTWQASKRLTWNSGSSLSPRIAGNSSNIIHVVWRDESSAAAQVYYKKSTNGGTTWGGSKRLSWTSGGSYDPVVALGSGNTVHVVWNDETPGNSEIYYKRSTDGGSTWGGITRLTWNSGLSHYAEIGVDSSGNVYVVWSDYTPGDPEIYYRRSTNGGMAWEGVKRLTWSSVGTYQPEIAVDSTGIIHVLWHSASPGNSEILHKRSIDGGATWSGANRLTWTSGSSFTPAVAVDSSDNLHVVWYDNTPGNLEVFYKRSTDGGATWGGTKRLTWNSLTSSLVEITVDSNDYLHVVWQDESPGNYEIYYKTSTNGGMAWGSAKRLTWNSGYSNGPAIAVGMSNSLHVIWFDNSPGNYEVFYKKGIQ
jgi:hypothetical protein